MVMKRCEASAVWLLEAAIFWLLLNYYRLFYLKMSRLMSVKQNEREQHYK